MCSTFSFIIDPDSNTPQPIAHLLDSLREYTDYIQPDVSKLAIPIDFVDYSNVKMLPHTETSYIPDLTQGEFQPLEEADDEWLEKIDLEAIIKSVESMTVTVPVSQQEVTDHNDTLMMNMSSKEKTVQSHVLPLLKLHPAIPKKKEVKA